MRGLLFCVIASAAVVSGARAQEAPFRDVPPGHYAFDAVNSLAARSVLKGYPDGSYRGRRAITRYEAALGLTRLQAAAGDLIDESLRKRQSSFDRGGPKGPAGAAGPQGPAGPEGRRGPSGPPGVRPAEIDDIRRELGMMRDSLTRLRETFGEIGKDIPPVRAGVQESWEDLQRLQDRVRRGQKPIPGILRGHQRR